MFGPQWQESVSVFHTIWCGKSALEWFQIDIPKSVPIVDGMELVITDMDSKASTYSASVGVGEEIDRLVATLHEGNVTHKTTSSIEKRDDSHKQMAQNLTFSLLNSFWKPARRWDQRKEA